MIFRTLTDPGLLVVGDLKLRAALLELGSEDRGVSGVHAVAELEEVDRDQRQDLEDVQDRQRSG